MDAQAGQKRKQEGAEGATDKAKQRRVAEAADAPPQDGVDPEPEVTGGGPLPPNRKADTEVQHVFFRRAKLLNLLAERPPRATFGGKVLQLDLDTELTVGDALKLLESHKIASAPVVRKATAEEAVGSGVSGKTCLGVFSAQTVLHETIRVIKEAERGGDAEASPWDPATQSFGDWDRLADAGREFCRRRLREVKFGGTGRDVAFLYSDFGRASLEDLLRYAFVGRDGAPIHRVVLCDADKQIRDLVSQSDVVRFVHAHLWRLGSLQHRTVLELGLGSADPVTVPDTAAAGEAFQRMLAGNFSCVGVTDAAGRLVANASASDLRAMTGADFFLFSFPVLEFLKRRATGGAAPSVVTCDVGTELREVLRRLVEDRLHRIWCVDEDGRPVRVVSLSDVLGLLLRQDLEPEP